MYATHFWLVLKWNKLAPKKLHIIIIVVTYKVLAVNLTNCGVYTSVATSEHVEKNTGSLNGSLID